MSLVRTVVRRSLFRAASLAFAFAVTTCVANAQQLQLYSVSTIATSHADLNVRTYFGRINDNFNSLQRAAGTHATLYYVNDRAVNAFATIRNGQYIVVLNVGLLSTLGGDSDAVAAVMGHELGHVLHDHVQQGANVNQILSLATGLAGLVVDAELAHKGHAGAVGVGQVSGQIGYKLASTAYTRDQERMADHEAVRLLLQAELDPAGAVRAMEALQRLGTREPPLLFATHPPTAERIESLRQEVANTRPQYEAIRQRREAQLAQQRKDDEARILAETERKREEQLTRQASHEETGKALIKRGKQTEGEAALLSQGQKPNSPVGSNASDNVGAEQCTDISPTRRSCTGLDQKGQMVVRSCSRTDAGEWQCKTI